MGRSIDDATDLFERALHLEEEHEEEGWVEGERDGRDAGIAEGCELGFSKGFEIGAEVGYYSGCHAVWAKCLDENPAGFGERATRGVEAFGALLTAFPMDDPTNESIIDVLHAARAKFKTVVSLLGLHREYNAADTHIPSFEAF